LTLTDSLIQNDYVLIDATGNQFIIKCIGDKILSPESLLVKHNILNVYSANLLQSAFEVSFDISDLNKPINLKLLSENMYNSTDIDDIIDELVSEQQSSIAINDNSLIILKQLPVIVHAHIAEYCISMIVKCILKQQNKVVDINKISTFLMLIEYYESYKMILKLSDTLRTTIEHRYKKYISETGSTWQSTMIGKSKTKSINTTLLPIGHFIKGVLVVLDVETLKWIEITNLYKIVKWEYPFNMYLYEERNPISLEVTVKYKNLLEKSSKGINMAFLTVNNINDIGKIFKINVSNIKNKIDKVESIIKICSETEIKYRQSNSNKKCYYKFYEIIP
jgi:hypothetical protein